MDPYGSGAGLKHVAHGVRFIQQVHPKGGSLFESKKLTFQPNLLARRRKKQ